MSSPLDRVVDALYSTPGVSQFVAEQRATTHIQSRWMRGPDGASLRLIQREWRDDHIDIAVFRDLEAGRGSTRLRVHGEQIVDDIRSWQALAKAAADRAGTSLEPAWTLPAPAAPARVTVADPVLLREPERVLEDLHHKLDHAFAGNPSRPDDKPGSASVQAVEPRDVIIDIETGQVQIQTSHGFTHSYQHTSLSVELAVAPRNVAEPFIARTRREVRRVEDLDPERLIDRLATQAVDRQRAQPTPLGRYDLVITGSARAPQRVSASLTGINPEASSRDVDTVARYGWFAPFVAHADAHWARHGLTRYRPGQSIHGALAPTGDPLTVISDGTLPFGLLSRPIGDLGAPVRRFSLIERGIATGLSSSLREAAIRGVPANGGVGNLRILPGTMSSEAIARPIGRDILRVSVLDWVDVDTRSGAFAAQIGLGYLANDPRRAGHRGPATGGRPVTGGLIRSNVFDLWADARLSSDTDISGWYHGPIAIRFNGITVS